MCRLPSKWELCLVLCWSVGLPAVRGTERAELPAVPPRDGADWLVERPTRRAGVFRGERPGEIVLDNGLVRRSFILAPNAACVEFRQLTTGESILRAVRPECEVTLDGVTYPVGGVLGQPIGNFLLPEWLDELQADPKAFRYTGFEVGVLKARFPWKRRRKWMAQDRPWPPPGVELALRFVSPLAPHPDTPGRVVLEDRFEDLDRAWVVKESSRHPETTFAEGGRPGALLALDNTHVFAERPWPEDGRAAECEVDPGSDRSASWGPGVALVFDDGVLKLYLRPGKAEIGVTSGSQERTFGGYERGTARRLRLALAADNTSVRASVLDAFGRWKTLAEVPVRGKPPLALRVGKMSRSGGANDYQDQPTAPTRSRIAWIKILGAPDAEHTARVAGLSIEVHYALYDGLPLVSKWISLQNTGARPVRLDSFSSEILACVEASSEVEDMARVRVPNLHVETDFTTVSMTGESAQRETVHWLPDPAYTTQVNYRLRTPCVLECRPPLGPACDVGPSETFASFRTWILAHDGSDCTRQTLSLCRMYRTIAPWVAENPLIHHVRSARPEAVRLAIDQCAGVGFELVIMTFGSGFNIENDSGAYRHEIEKLVDYAHARGIALGGYSLLASRSVGAAHDVVNRATGRPGGFATFGASPCLESAWGREYFGKLYEFFESTGCDVLEHDGSYPGDACASSDHPGHRGYEDSRWRQWETIVAFYRWCRGRGIYLNVPDWYFLNGSSKTGMGYRETNWSLPRHLQELIERQNIHDGTRYKTPTMGWMFVPLTEYHGGGAAATIEPLDEHLDHYSRRLANLLGAGVQACFRGPRLFDTERTRLVVKEWVDFYKRHRAILESDIVALRRADGRDWDGLLHVNPRLPEAAFAMLYNPLGERITRSVRFPLYYAGLVDRARLRVRNGPAREVTLHRDASLTTDVEIPAEGWTWIVFERPEGP